jgi:hypothetical protein
MKVNMILALEVIVPVVLLGVVFMVNPFTNSVEQGDVVLPVYIRENLVITEFVGNISIESNYSKHFTIKVNESIDIIDSIKVNTH